jgi:surfeit locus 1 family protein
MQRFAFLMIFGLGGAAILVSLGIWQMQRLAWKEAMIADIEARIAADPVPLPGTPDPETDNYLPVSVTGTFRPDFL